MSATDYLTAWDTVERGCFEYLGRVLGTLENVTAFTTTSFPRTMPSDDREFFIWHFAINGGAVDVMRQTREQVIGGAWHMDAEFVARCTDDATAKAVACAVINALPATSADVPGLADRNGLYFTNYPTRESIVVNLESDESAGEERRFIEVKIQMKAAFTNV